MDRKSFNDMEILKQIEFINNKLKEYDSFNKLCKGEGLPKSTLSERFKNNGYRFIDGQYRLIQEDIKENTSSSITKVHNDSTSNVEALNDDILKTIKDMQKELDTLKKEVKELKGKAPNNKLTLFNFNGSSENKSFRIDSDVLENFNKFCKKNKKYKKQDLLSQAIQEFINKYN